jgi:hypothetical protein
MHACKVPGKLRIVLRRAKPGDKFFCTCGKLFELGLVGSRETGKIRHSWTEVEDEEIEVGSNTSPSQSGVGFQANSN